MVDEPHRRSNTTLQMYKEIIRFVLAHRIEVALLDCEPHHLNSYLKLGFRPIGETYSYPGIGLVIPMLLIAGDYQHMIRIGSPFALLVNKEDLNYCQHTDELLSIFEQSSNLLSQASTDKAEFIQQINADASLLATDSPKIFDLLSQDELDRVIEKSHIIECKLGDHIIEQNNAAKTLFVLLSGIVKVERNGLLQALISPGEAIGEIAFFLNVPRTANIIAATNDVRVLSIDDAAISRLLKYDSVLANKILLNLCRLLCTRVINNFETATLRENVNSLRG
jgi:CRP-like cAMP-binding protein